MSTTHVIGKRAAVCTDESGVRYFLLSEQSYESNVWPRTPRWSARFFGTFEDCMRRIVNWSGCCEGGSLSGTARTPGAYIKQWREALAAPVELAKSVRTARIGTGLYEVPEALREAFNQVFRRHGFSEPVGNEMRIDMNAAGALALIAELTSGSVDGLYIWRLMDAGTSYMMPRPELGVAVPARTKAPMPDVQVFTFGAERQGMDPEHLLVVDGRATMTGWAYSTVGAFLSNCVADAEAKTPGVAEQMLSAFRKIMGAAPALAGSVTVTIRKPAEDAEGARWHLEKFEQIRSATGHVDGPTLTVSMRELYTANIAHVLRYLPDSLVDFDVASKAATQLELLAA